MWKNNKYVINLNLLSPFWSPPVWFSFFLSFPWRYRFTHTLISECLAAAATSSGAHASARRFKMHTQLLTSKLSTWSGQLVKKSYLPRVAVAPALSYFFPWASLLNAVSLSFCLSLLSSFTSHLLSWCWELCDLVKENTLIHFSFFFRGGLWVR